eukprot:g19009.t1
MQEYQRAAMDIVPTDGHIQLKHKKYLVMGMGGFLDIIVLLALIGVIDYPNVGDHPGFRMIYLLTIALTSALGIYGAYKPHPDLLLYFMYLMLFLAAISGLGVVIDVFRNVKILHFIWDLLVALSFLLTASFANALRLNEVGYRPILSESEPILARPSMA